MTMRPITVQHGFTLLECSGDTKTRWPVPLGTVRDSHDPLALSCSVYFVRTDNVVFPVKGME
jgi:hypothetical protein